MQNFGLENKKKKKSAKTPQNKAIPGREKDMRVNNAGGVSFKLDKWSRLERFLILGTEGGTYYVSQKKLDKQNTTNLLKCIQEDYKRTVDIIVDISDKGRAANNDAAIFALAMIANSENKEARNYALHNLNKVCRIGTHLFHFAEYIGSTRGWGRSVRKSIQKWYTDRSNDSLSLQLLKYQQRDGWSHKDVLRLAHVKPETPVQGVMFRCVVGKSLEWPTDIKLCQAKNILANKEMDVNRVIRTIKTYGIPREMVPTEFLNDSRVWMELLKTMPVMAMVRNLNKMAQLGLLGQMSDGTNLVISALTDNVAIKKSRIHPMALMNAIKVYGSGSNITGAAHGRSASWPVNQTIVSALEKAFYISFGNIEPTGKSMMLALDVSGSMTSRMSNSVLTCREASAVMAMVTARVEEKYGFFGFTCGGRNTFGKDGSSSYSGISELNIGPNQSFKEVINTISGLDFSGTDCSLPVLCAQSRKLFVDTFCVYTDNETWAGRIQPSQALKNYRKTINPNAKMVVVGMTANNISIADPEDAGMLDVVGFDTNTPNIISEFTRG